MVIERRERQFNARQVERKMDIGVKFEETLFPKSGQPALREGAGAVDFDQSRDALLRLVRGQTVELEPAVGIGAVVGRILLLRPKQLNIRVAAVGVEFLPGRR